MLRPLLLAALIAAAPVTGLAGQFVDFAGHTWLVRGYGGGPGPNEWRESNVYVDAAGLHLAIRRDGDVWTCAEVFMMGDPLGFGTYEFEVSGDLAALDGNAVLGLFNYPASPQVGPDGTNEIDIEFAQWGDLQNPNRLNWNIYPATAQGEKGHEARPLTLPPGPSTHRFDWSADRIDYASFAGRAGAGDTTPIGEWSYAPADAARDIPQVPLVVHMNLWLVEGKAPAGNAPVEVVITGFRFTPG